MGETVVQSNIPTFDKMSLPSQELQNEAGKEN